jgi:hypothetical protein
MTGFGGFLVLSFCFINTSFNLWIPSWASSYWGKRSKSNKNCVSPKFNFIQFMVSNPIVGHNDIDLSMDVTIMNATPRKTPFRVKKIKPLIGSNPHPIVSPKPYGGPYSSFSLWP